MPEARLAIAMARGTEAWPEVWHKTAFHCLRCGEASVWTDYQGDYDSGYPCLCLACHALFFVTRDPAVSEDPQDARRIALLQEGP